jgi:hypothetical protein
MKKLKLKLEGVREMLTKEQMRKISGGYGGSLAGCTECASPCPSGTTCTSMPCVDSNGQSSSGGECL